MHLELSFTRNIEIGAQRILSQDALEVVQQDSGLEVRNLRAEDEPLIWSVALPTEDTGGSTVDQDSVYALWGNGAGGSFRGLHSFNFTDFVDGNTYRVRFAAALQTTGPAGHLRHIDSFTLREVLETSPSLTVAPAITGTATVGHVLTVSNGTWTGSPVSFAYQWTRDGVDIAGATAATHLLVSADSGHLIAGYVTATDADGGSTRAWATGVSVP